MIRIVGPSSSIDLPPTFHWSDEAQWDPIAQTIKPLLPDNTGEASILIQETKKKAGRPITLQGQVQRAALTALRDLAATRPALTLQMTGQPDRSARFRFEGGAALNFSQLVATFADPGDEDWYEGQIKLLEV